MTIGVKIIGGNAIALVRSVMIASGMAWEMPAAGACKPAFAVSGA